MHERGRSGLLAAVGSAAREWRSARVVRRTGDHWSSGTRSRPRLLLAVLLGLIAGTSIIVPTAGAIPELPIEPGAATERESFGSVIGQVWVDESADGVRQDDEPAIAGVEVTIRDGSGGRVDGTPTDAEGRYVFAGVPAGDYDVEIQLPDDMSAGVVLEPAATATVNRFAVNADDPAVASAPAVAVEAESIVEVDAGLIPTSPVDEPGGATPNGTDSASPTPTTEPIDGEDSPAGSDDSFPADGADDAPVASDEEDPSDQDEPAVDDEAGDEEHHADDGEASDDEEASDGGDAGNGEPADARDLAPVAGDEELVQALDVPDPGSSESVISVKVGGDRAGAAGVTELAGVVLQLYDGDQNGSTTPVNEPWATCTSDVDGDCSFVVPDTGFLGSNWFDQFWVVQQSVPTGWFDNSDLAVGVTPAARPYEFRSPNLWGGNTYLSTVDFMVGTGTQNTGASGGIWQNSRVNPTLAAQCGLNVALIMDLSGSVSGSLPSLKQAATTLTNALVGTPSRMSLFTFASNAPRNNTDSANLDTLQPVSTQAGANVVNTRINGLTTGGGTNWDRGLAQVAASPNSFDVAVFITDGNPTFYGLGPEGPGNRTRFREVENGVFSANAIKAEGTRMIAFGVGTGVSSPSAALNLVSVSGPTLNSDYYQTTNYNQAGDQLRALALGSCQGAVTVIKEVIPPGGVIADSVPDGGWEFAATSPTAVVNPAVGTTAVGTGAVSFAVDLGAQASAAVEVSETQQAGYLVVPNNGNNATCVRLDTGAPAPGYQNGATPEQFTVTANANYGVACTVYNLEPNPVASLTVDKVWSISSNGDTTIYEQGEQPVGIDAQLLVDGSGEPWGSTIQGITAGTSVELDENILPLPTGCELTGTVVTDGGGNQVSGGLPYSPTLAVGANEFVVTNSIACFTELTLVKTVANGSALPGDWTLEALLPVPPPPNAFDGPSGPTGVTGLVTPSITYDLVETGDPNYVQFVAENAVINPPRTGSWSCVEIDENGAVIPGYSDGLNGGVTVPLGLFVRCTAVNRTAELTLIKHVENSHGGTAAAGDWELTATPVSPPPGVTAQTVTGSETGETINVRPGLTYDLTETDVAGYELDSIECVTNPNEQDPADTWAWAEVPSQSIDVAALSFDSQLEHIYCRFNNVDLQPYQLVITPGTATNRLGDQHNFWVELRTDSDGDGELDDPVVGETIELTWSGPAGSGIDEVNGATVPGAPASSASCTTLAPFGPYLGGLCQVTVTSPDDVGSGSLDASFDLPDPAAGVPDLPTPDNATTCTNPTIVGGVITVCNAVQDTLRIEETATKTWVGYLVNVEPDGTNPVDVTHTFTIDVDRTDGTTATPADGVVVSFTWTGDGAVTEVNGSPAPGAVECSTDANGQCTVTVESPLFGTGTLTVTSVAGDLIGQGVRTETPIPGSDLTATKTWVDWRVLLTPDATNLVGDEHVFTATLQRDDGSGWVAEPNGSEIFFSWSGPTGSEITAVSAGAVTDPTSAFCQPDANGECTVTVNSTAAGSGTLTAFEIVVELPGYTPPQGGTTFSFDIDDATADKTWVGFQATVDGSATNIVGDDHVFTLTATYDDGNGIMPVPAGSTIGFTWSGASPAVPSSECVTDAAGECTVTVSSPVAGSGAIAIESVTANIGGADLTGEPPSTLVPSAGGSLDATKTWVEFQATVGDTATNLAGDPHTFTLSATYDDGSGGGPTAVPDGTIIAFTWTGDGAVTAPAPDATTCLTAAGSCQVTVESAAPGSGTIELVSVTALLGPDQVTGVATSTPPGLVVTTGGSLTADKTWVGITVGVEATGVNVIGDDHVFTLTAVYDDGSGAPQPANGASFSYAWTGAGTPAPASPCVSAPTENTCEVTVSSDVPGSGTMTIDTVTATVDGVPFTDVPAVATAGESLTADKTWVLFQATVDGAATNLSGDDHVFTLTATYDDGSGPTPVPAGSTIGYSWSGATGAVPPANCVTDAVGECTVTVSSTDAGSGTITIVAVSASIAGFDLTGVPSSVPASLEPSAGGSLDATKTWLAFDVDITPLTASNPVDVDHTFTIAVLVDDGTGLVPLTDPPGTGSSVDWSFEAPGGAITTGSCTLEADGTCDVVLGSTEFGTGTLTATSLDVTYDGVDLPPVDLTASGPGQSPDLAIPVDADKTWIDWRVLLTPPTATNAVDEQHVFTATLERNDGTGWVPEGNTNGERNILVEWTGPAGSEIVTTQGIVDPDGQSAICSVDVSGVCTFTVQSPISGAGTLTAVGVNVAIDGYTPPGGSPGESFAFDIDDATATKTWVEIRGSVTPPAATNVVGDGHEFTILIETSDDGGATWTLAPAGTTVDFVWSGPGGVTAVDVQGPDPDVSCELRADGTCAVTISSDDAGLGTLTIGDVTSLVVNGTELVPPGGGLPVEDADASAGVDSRVGVKTWVEFQATVGDTATNLIGDDHVFTVTATYDEGTGPAPVPDGSSVAFTWTGDGQVTAPTPDATSCVTTGGSCTVTVASATPGSGTIEIVSVTATIGPDQVTGVATTTPPSLVVSTGGSLTADKTWIDLTVGVEATSVNLTGDDHVFTLTAVYDDGSGSAQPANGASFAYTWIGTGTPAPGTPCVAAPTENTCEVTVSSTDPGAGTITIDTVTATVNGTTFTDLAAVATAGESLTADKTWVEFDVDITPLTAINQIGDAHTFTISVQADAGAGLVPLTDPPATGTVDWTWAGPGGLADSGTCVLAADGTCDVVQNSTVGGSGTLTAIALDVVYDGVALPTVDLAAAGSGQSPDLSIPVEANKSWVGYSLTLDPEDAVNVWPTEPDHVVTLSLDVQPPGLAPIAGQDLDVTLTSSVATITAVSGGTVDPGGLTATCVTDANGDCEVTLTSTGPGAATLSASYEAVFQQQTITVDGNDADKTWVAFEADVATTATNLTGDDHVFTLSALYDVGSGPTAVPDGSTIDFTWSGDGVVTAPSPGATSCETTAGSCTVTVSSPDPGSGTIEITSVTADVGGTGVTASAATTPPGLAPTTPGSLTADKTWLAFDVDITPLTASNPVDVDHTFTIAVRVDDGTGLVPLTDPPGTGSVDWSFTAPGGGVSTGTCVLEADGTCEVVLGSAVAGTGTLTATSLDVTYDGVVLPPVDLTASGSGQSSDLVIPVDADKTWVDWRVLVSPDATNLVGDEHVFTLTLERDDGTGWVAEGAGNEIAVAWAGPAGSAIVAVSDGTIVPGGAAGACTTDASGQCTVTVNSPVAGTGTLTVTEVVVGLPGYSPLFVFDIDDVDAFKTWIELTVGVEASAINLTGDDHVFTLTAVFDDGSGSLQQADGASFAYTWSGPGTAAPPSPCAATPTANTCEVTVSSTDPGVGTITIDSVTATVGGVTFTDVVAVATAGEELTADKTWVAFDVDITPEQAINPIGEEHTFTISVRVDDGTGLAPLAIPPDSGTVDWTYDAPDGTSSNGTCTLGAGGTCEEVRNTTIGGVGTLTATALDVVYDGVTLPTIDLTAPGPGQSSDLTIPVEGVKAWIGFSLTLDPPTATNLWPTEADHVVTLTLAGFPPTQFAPVDGQALDVTLTSSVAAITDVSDGTVIDDTTATCITDTNGDCQVTITSTGPGAATVSAKYEAVFQQQTIVVEGNDADKTWRTFRVRVTPANATNLLGDDHTFNVFVERSSDGTTWSPVVNATPSVNVSSPASITTETCSAGTDASGKCTVTATSPRPALVTLDASYTGQVGQATAVFESSAQKRWIDYQVEVDPPEAENLVDTDHEFTVTVRVDRGNGAGFVPLAGAVPSLSLSGPGTIVSQTCSDGTAADGTCSVIIESTEPGSTTVAASYEGRAGGQSVIYRDSGAKTWVDYRIAVAPRAATNEIGDPHTFVVTLEVDTGSGFGPADGETIELTASGVGGITDVHPAVNDAGSCRTDGSGQCRVTVNSNSPGSLTLIATYGAQVGSTSSDYADSGVKTWVRPTPPSTTTTTTIPLPPTGSDSFGYLPTATLLLAAGVVLVVLARRRSRAAS